MSTPVLLSPESRQLDTLRRLHIAATGYVATSTGSVAGANAVLLRQLLLEGHRVSFHAKPHFVDPRPAMAGCDERGNLSFVDCTNRFPDQWKRKIDRRGGLLRTSLGYPISLLDNRTYRRAIVRSIDESAGSDREPSPNVALWLGTWAYRHAAELPTVSFVQGPPGTDARSILRHRETIVRLGGRALYAKLRAYALWRLNFGLPRFGESDHVIVGSRWSREMLVGHFGLAKDKVHCLPYPIDLNLFAPPPSPRPSTGPLRVMWVGRFVPRKRLDLFLDGLVEAIRQGVDVVARVIGSSAFVPHYERLLDEFPYPDRLVYHSPTPRAELPSILQAHDVLAQPSDEENFGSSVAEAQACGMPVIVGATNGTSDYVCERSICLTDDRPSTFAAAIARMADHKRLGSLAEPNPSRHAAERHYAPEVVTRGLQEVLDLAIKGTS